MKKLLFIALFVLWPVIAFAWSIGDVVWLKSGGPAMTVTSVLPGDGANTGLHWFAGLNVVAVTLPADALTNVNPNP